MSLPFHGGGGVSKKSRCQAFLNLAPNHLNFFFGLWLDLPAQA